MLCPKCGYPVHVMDISDAYALTHPKEIAERNVSYQREKQKRLSLNYTEGEEIVYDDLDRRGGCKIQNGAIGVVTASDKYGVDAIFNGIEYLGIYKVDIIKYSK